MAYVGEFWRFDGEPDDGLEIWLTDFFQSWLPSLGALAVRVDGRDITVTEGDWLVVGRDGELRVFDGSVCGVVD